MIHLELHQLDEKEKVVKKAKENLVLYEKELTKTMKEIEQKLHELQGIEYHLFYEIVVRGTNVTRAVDKVSLEYDKDVSTIWKNYYPTVKAQIQELNEKYEEDH